MTRGIALTLLLLAGLSGCRRAPENEAAVRQGVMEHLQNVAGLDMNQLNVDIADVKFQGNEAVASVAIKPRTAPEQGMTMSYTLDRRGDKWVVRGRGAGHGGMGMGMGGEGGPAAGDQPLPPGHPPTQGGQQGGDLPPGHPPVNNPPPPAK